MFLTLHGFFLIQQQRYYKYQLRAQQYKKTGIMKPINIIQQRNGEIYCIVDPLACLNQSQFLSYNNLIECKYCKSITIPTFKSNKNQCTICKCYTDLPSDYSEIVPMKLPQYILTSQPTNKIPNTSKNIPNSKNIKNKSSNTPKPHNLRLLIVCQAKLDNNFIQGLQCLQPILQNYHNMQICLLTYGTQIRLVQLQQDGRVITIHYESMQLINDKFYPVSQESITQIFRVLQDNKLDNKVVINGSKVMVEVLEKLRHTDMIVLWLGTLTESMQYYSYPSYINTDIYCILKVPYSLNNHTQMTSLQKLNINSTRVKYILRTDSPTTITEKVYYQLYQIFQHETVANIRLQASRERKYPPEILTYRSRVLGSLNNSVIIKIGKSYEDKQKVQLRIMYTQIIQQQNVQKQSKQQQNQQIKLLTGNPHRQKTLIITIPLQNIPIQGNAQLCRYLRMYLFLKSYHLSTSIHHIDMMKINNDDDIDLCHFWKDSSFMQRAQLYCNLDNCHCIYAVWPLIGICAASRKVMFVYYFNAYHISDQQYHHQQQQHKYTKQIQQLNQLCQIVYCRQQKTPPLCYQHMIRQLNQSSHLNQSDESDQQQQNQEQDQYRQVKRKEMKRYYEVLIK